MKKSKKKILSDTDMDVVLEMYYRRDVLHENATADIPGNIRDVESVLQTDGMVAPAGGRLRLTNKGRATYCTGGYSEKTRKELEDRKWQRHTNIMAAVYGALAGGAISLIAALLSS